MIICVLLVVIDFLLKIIATKYLSVIGTIDLIPGCLSFTYLINHGAGFGILQNKTQLLTIISLVVSIAMICAVLFKWFNNQWLDLSCTLIASGGFGNLIDRVFNNGGVVDYIYFKLINFPIFNFADICVTVGAIIMIAYLLFFDETNHKNLNKEGS